MKSKFVLLFLALAIAPFGWPPTSLAQIEIIPGSSQRGAELFQKQGCIDCHAAQPAKNGLTPLQLASALWNHAPRMWEAQAKKNVRPMIDSMDTADLFAYFYSLAYSNTPGNLSRGNLLFEQKGCAGCHKATPSSKSARPLGPPLSTWRHVADPLAWAEQMWNHSGKILNELSATGVEWPKFSTEEMVDLLAYLRDLPETRSQSAVFQPGDPEQGRMTFDRSCIACHTFGGPTADAKIDLLKRPSPRVLTDYVAAMWNHAPAMHERAANAFPVLGPGDMSNLVAYLFAQRYFSEEGNAKTGALLFQTKNCIVCHEQRRNQTGAPDLTMATERYSPITISAAIWRHGPAMLKTANREELAWPQLQAAEMLDLITYLNSRLIARLAAEK